MRTALVLAAAFAATVSLCACQKPADNTTASSTTATTAGGASPAASGGGGGLGGALSASDMPKPKPGLWKMHMTNSDLPRGVDYSECITPESSKVDWAGKSGADHHCDPHFSRGLDGSIHGTATCTMERGMTMAMDVRVAGDYNNRYTVHIDSTMSGAPIAALNRKHSMDIESVYAGPCAPGQKGSIRVGE